MRTGCYPDLSPALKVKATPQGGKKRSGQKTDKQARVAFKANRLKTLQ
jgi:hypothetical protein